MAVRLPVPPGPVVVFLPAHDEEATVAAVVATVPALACGRRVECLVVDDGSGDRTAELAAGAGATVLSVATNRGLGRPSAWAWPRPSSGARPRSPSATPTASTTRASWRGWSPPSWRAGATTSSAPASPGRSGACCPSAASATWPSRPCSGSRGQGPGRRRPERLPGPVAGGRGRRRDRPRLQLRSGAHPRPAGQGPPLPGGPDRLPLPQHRPLLRAPPALPAPGRPGGVAGAQPGRPRAGISPRPRGR